MPTTAEKASSRWLVDPDAYRKIQAFEARVALRKFYEVRYAVESGPEGPVYCFRQFDYEADAAAFADLVRESGGCADEPEARRESL